MSQRRTCRPWLLILTLLWAAGRLSAQEPALEDPLPLQRIVIPADRLALELAKAKQGLLLPLPREEFEARVQRAARAQQASAQPPRLVQARYVAELQDNHLVGRSGTWQVHQPGPLPGALALPAF